jgi:cell division protein FtsN
VNNDLKIITAMHSEYELQMKDTYLRTFDMSAALDEKTRLEEQKKRLDEYEAAQKKAQQEADLEQSQNAQLYEATQPITETHFYHPEAKEPEQIKTIKAIFYDTTGDFRREMRELIKKHNIRCGGIN